MGDENLCVGACTTGNVDICHESYREWFSLDSCACADGSEPCLVYDPCLHVTCGPPDSQCQNEATCVEGECVYTFKPEGVKCDDEDKAPIGDTCNGKGKCVGKSSKGMGFTESSSSTGEKDVVPAWSLALLSFFGVVILLVAAILYKQYNSKQVRDSLPQNGTPRMSVGISV